jgi:Fic family protein
MSQLLLRHWTSDGNGLSRRQRTSCDYEAYSPDPLLARAFRLDGDVAADVADAETAVARLNDGAAALVNTEALARMLLRAEAVASSRIEGLRVGARRLLHAEVSRRIGAGHIDITASEILRNIEAMDFGLARLAVGDDITLELLLETHRRLLEGSILKEHGGRLRDAQNWIGGNEFNPCAAAYVPPPPELVKPLLDDLLAFSNDDRLPAVVQAAIAHAQFETIHPFVDGNGRIGRLLVHQILRRRGLAVRVLAPVSLVLAAQSNAYVGSLTRFRYVGDAASEGAHEGVNLWVGHFATSCRLAVARSTEFEETAKNIETGWREDVGSVRAKSATDRLLRVLCGAPVVTVNAVAELIDCSFNAANDAVDNLVKAKVLRQVTLGKRNRAFEAPKMIEAFTDLERVLITPSADHDREVPTADH